MRILKFGGTSVGSRAAIDRILGILGDSEHTSKTGASKREVPVVVVSALSGVTDALIEMARTASTGGLYTESVAKLAARHRDIAAHFLKADEKKDAVAEMNGLLSELSRVLEGISLLGELSVRTLDMVMSFGERLSAGLLARIFTAHGIESAFLDTRLLIKANDRFGNAQYLSAPTFAYIRAFLSGAKLPLGEPLSKGEPLPKGSPYPKGVSLPKGARIPLQVATGFIASTRDGQTVTLGRGGSDLTAAIFAAALKADEVEIWTDVDGIQTADPRIVANAFRIDEILYTEAMEISHFGAKFLFPPTVKPALEQGIPISIRNTFNPESSGTRIVNNAAEGKYPIRGISSISDIALIRVQGPGMVGVAGFSARVFGALARRGISVIMITQSSSEYSICFAVLPADARQAERAIEEEFAPEIQTGGIDKPAAQGDLSVIAVVGSKMKSHSGISGKFFHALGRNGINVVAIAQGSSEINISAVISRQDEAKALNAVHEAFFQATLRSVNLFLMGTGLIGGTLLEQIAAQQKKLAEKDQIQINLIGAANYKWMLFDRAGLDPQKAKALINEEGDQKTGKGKKTRKTETALEPVNIKAFVAKMVSLNLPNACFCDCTANQEIADMYGAILGASIPVVTPNKRANSGKLEYYRTLTGFSRDRGIAYLYETTVCAGLPVISTLRDLYLSGDRVRRIEAVLSGTLSFIFNNFDGTKTFSALLREAKAKGYTEPDPRDDLNAMDAARKALILARECGLSLEFAHVAIEPILPAACFKAKDVDAFFKELEKSDAVFEKRRAEAAAQGKALRYVAVVEEGKAQLALRPEPAGSPFRSLVDSDNMVVITTDRYSKLPMVIKGPGAGAQVTAGGVFADIVRIARTLV